MGTAVAVVFILVVAVLAWLVLRRPTKKKSARRPGRRAKKQPAAVAHHPGGIDKLRENPDFWGVQIGQAGCEAARALMENTYSMDEAPELPVQGCDSAACTCIFKGLLNKRNDHRRTHEERRGELRLEEGKPSDRRSRKDRRRGSNWNDRSY